MRTKCIIRCFSERLIAFDPSICLPPALLIGRLRFDRPIGLTVWYLGRTKLLPETAAGRRLASQRGGGGGGEAAAAARRRRRGAGRLLAGRVWNFRFVR